VPVGQYHIEPGVEMQHDTSPHEVEVGGRKYKARTASAVLCYSRMLFFQINPTFQRFDCKVFLTDAVRYMKRRPGTHQSDPCRDAVITAQEENIDFDCRRRVHLPGSGHRG
jgi:hypothetical protein